MNGSAVDLKGVKLDLSESGMSFELISNDSNIASYTSLEILYIFLSI